MRAWYQGLKAEQCRTWGGGESCPHFSKGERGRYGEVGSPTQADTSVFSNNI